MSVQHCCRLSSAVRILTVLILSLVLSSLLALGADDHRQLSRYEIELFFDSTLPSLPVHAIKLEHAPSFGDFRNELAVYNFSVSGGDALIFDFETLSEKISSFRLVLANDLSPKVPQLPGLLKVRSGGVDADFAIFSDARDGSNYELGTEVRFSKPLTPVSATLLTGARDEQSGFFSIFLLSFLIIFFLLLWLCGSSQKSQEMSVRRSFILLTLVLYFFDIVLVAFFARGLDDQYQILLSNFFLCTIEWLAVSVFIFSLKGFLLQTLIAILFCIVILAQFMCLELSCSYISPVSIGNINFDNLDVLFNKYNWKYPALAFLLFLFLLASHRSKLFLLSLSAFRRFIVRLSFVSAVLGLFLLNVLPNGSRIDSFQSPLVGLAKTALHTLFPGPIESYLSVMSSTKLKEYQEPCFSSFASFCSPTVYDSKLPFNTIIEPKSPNLILIFAESLTAEFIDSYRNSPLGIMPFTSSVHLSKAGNARVTLVRNFFNHSATTLRNIRGQLISGFQRGALPGRIEKDLSSMVNLMEKEGYVPYFLTGEKSSTFESLLHTVGFRYILSPNQNSIDQISLDINKCSRDSECSDLELAGRLEAIVDYHNKIYSKDSKPFLISVYNYGTHLNHDGELKFGNGDNIIFNRIFTLDHALKDIVSFYSRELSSNTVMVLTADHSIIPGDRGSDIIDFDQRFIVNQVPFYIFQPYYDLPSEFDLDNSRGYMNSLATAPTVMHLLGINTSNCFLGCSIFEESCNRSVDLSHYGWYMDSGFYFTKGKFENQKSYRPIVIDGKLQNIHNEIDFSLINHYRNCYLNLFDR